MESSWTVTGVGVEFECKDECQPDMKKDRNSMWKKKVQMETAQKSWQEYWQKILLTFWHENRAEQLSMTNALIFWWSNPNYTFNLKTRCHDYCLKFNMHSVFF